MQSRIFYQFSGEIVGSSEIKLFMGHGEFKKNRMEFVL